LFVSFRWSVIISELWRPEVARVGKKCRLLSFFGKKRPLTRKFSKFCSERIHHLTDLRLVLCAIFVEFGRSVIGKVVRYLADKKKNKISPRSLALATARGSRPKSARNSARQCAQSTPNRFTFGGAIAERVNTVKTHRKVFPTFGRSLASS